MKESFNNKCELNLLLMIETVIIIRTTKDTIVSNEKNIHNRFLYCPQNLSFLSFLRLLLLN